MIGDKVIFASAHPFLDFKGQIALYRKLPFSPQALENIFTTTPPSCLAFDGGQRAGSLVS